MSFGFLQPLICFGGDLIAYVPQFFIEEVLHTLVQNLDGRPHRAHHTASDDPLRKLQVVESEQVHLFVEVQQTLRDIVQAEELFVSPVEIVDR